MRQLLEQSLFWIPLSHASFVSLHNFRGRAEGRKTVEVGRERERGEYKERRSEVRKIRKPSRKRQNVKEEE
jgi:hypothetical protein